MSAEDRLRKIRAVAEDPRGDANTRAIAERMLKAHTPRAARTPPWWRDWSKWGETSKGNWAIETDYGSRKTVDGRAETRRRVVIYPWSKGRGYGWCVHNLRTDNSEFSDCFYATPEEARDAAWLRLTSV